MLKHLSFTCLFLFVTFCYSQKNYNYSVNKPYNSFESYNRYYFNDDEDILIVKAKKESVVIQKFNAETLVLISENKYEEPSLNYDIENVVKVENKIYFFYSLWTGRETHLAQLYFREIDINSGTFITKPKLLIEVDNKITKSPRSNYIDDKDNFKTSVITGFRFDIEVSSKNNEIFIIYRNYREHKKDTESWDTLVLNSFDVNLKRNFVNTFKMPYSERKMKTLNYNVHSNGNLQILAKVFTDDSGKEIKESDATQANYYLELLTFIKDSDVIQKSQIAFPNTFINSATLFELSNGNLLCAGYYNNGSSRKYLNHSDGMFVAKTTPLGEIIHASEYNFPKNILEQNEKHNKKKEFEDIVVKSFQENEDGSLLLIAEQSRKYNVENSIAFEYNDIYLTKINSETQLLWMQKIPKGQVGFVYKSDNNPFNLLLGEMSYHYFKLKEDHCFLFLDHLKNLKIDATDKPKVFKNGKSGYFTYYKINDISGEASKHNLFSTEDVHGEYDVKDFSTNRLITVYDNQFIMEVNKKKKEDVLIKVEIK
ncbi:hypothetical protein FG167_06440 [Lacinutrix sp. WUR7]|uniref:hypothetical protein n=1 Tax=Lacinutrix sp. WUR7 TaxID=2653681 RepID=UPI00193D3774|nr:hypothetical protein [Lacinutrix sp. WUR7]QRM88886.1 hypothetical protein FG167_06440 [Lacinutrix sp. WUR7]